MFLFNMYELVINIKNNAEMKRKAINDMKLYGYENKTDEISIYFNNLSSAEQANESFTNTVGYVRDKSENYIHKLNDYEKNIVTQMFERQIN